MKHSLEEIGRIREEYSKKSLRKEDVDPDPFRQFEVWFNEALESESGVPNALTLSTVSPDGQPNARVILLKGFSEEGFTFFTNYSSLKGNELEANPKAHILFFWDELQRQIRIEGLVSKVSREESVEYFQSRPRGSQVGGIASAQSSVIANREVLEEESARIDQQFASEEKLPCPESWGGYLLLPNKFEFWQGRVNRLHDRIVYERKDSGWVISRLAP